ncbi:MAG: dUTP diphosphatase [bacterium]|nr:dUTP diphosphatase [bacterium]
MTQISTQEAPLDNRVEIKIKKMAGCEDLPLPAYMSELAAGMDVVAAVSEPVVILPGDWAAIPTGFSIAIPAGYEAQIRPRSGLALRYGISLMNTPGTIDADYRGEVKIIVVNHGKEPFLIKRGDRIAQMVIHRVYAGCFKVVEDLPPTQRSDGGFGHSGV